MSTADLVVLGALVLAVAALSAGVALTAATNRELRGVVARWEYAAWALDTSGDVDGTVRAVLGGTMGAAARPPTREGQHDPWITGPSGST